MRLLWGADETISRLISSSFPELTEHSPFIAHAAVGFVNDDDEIVGGIAIRLLNSFDGSLSIFILPGEQLTRSMLRTMFTRAFREIGLTRLSCSIAKSNKRSRRLAERVGFVLEGTRRRGYDGTRDACLYGMLATECRWMDHGLARRTGPREDRSGTNWHEYRHRGGVERTQ